MSMKMHCLLKLMLLCTVTTFSIVLQAQKYRGSINGLFTRITPADTVYFALISDSTSAGDLDFIIEKLEDFNAKLKVTYFSTKGKRRIDVLGLEFSTPKSEPMKERAPIEGQIIGAFYNKAYNPPYGIGALDRKYLEEYTNLTKIYGSFKDTENLKIYLDGKLVDKSDHRQLVTYQSISPHKIRYLKVTANVPNPSIEIGTK